MATAQHVALERIAMLADGTLVRLHLQMIALDVLGESVAPLEDSLTDAALVSPLRAVGDAMLLQSGQRAERLLADATAVNSSFSRMAGQTRWTTAPLGRSLRWLPLAALELVPPVETPVGEANALAVPALIALQPGIAQRQ